MGRKPNIEKRQHVYDLSDVNPTLSMAAIARHVGCSEGSVAKWLRERDCQEEEKGSKVDMVKKRNGCLTVGHLRTLMAHCDGNMRIGVTDHFGDFIPLNRYTCISTVHNENKEDELVVLVDHESRGEEPE